MSPVCLSQSCPQSAHPPPPGPPLPPGPPGSPDSDRMIGPKARLMEVEQTSAEVGHFMVLDANDNEDSMTGSTTASRGTHDILVKCNADEFVQAWLHV